MLKSGRWGRAPFLPRPSSCSRIQPTPHSAEDGSACSSSSVHSASAHSELPPSLALSPLPLPLYQSWNAK